MFPALPEAGGLARAELEHLLRWQMEMGVDIAVDAEPRNRFVDSAADFARQKAVRVEAAAAPPAPQGAAPKAPLPSRPFEPAPQRAVGPAAVLLAQDAAAQSAREQARMARTLDELRATLEAFDGCALKRTASRLVFLNANPQARIMFVDEAPGDDDDRQGLPFVGRNGRLLDTMLAAIGLDRTHVYLANIVPWRPPGNRKPTVQEMAICLPFLRRQIELVNPDLIVCLGDIATQALLGVKGTIMSTRGNWYDLEIEPEAGARTIQALATLRPSYLLQMPSAKRHVWRDLRALHKAIAAAT